MPYATQEQMTERYGEAMLVAATDRAPIPQGVPDDAVIARALAAADAVIDPFVRKRYAMPLGSVPPLLADIAQSIAIWKLHPYAADPKLKDEYDAAMRLLRDIADGRAELDVAGIEPATSDTNGVRITDRERPMTEANLKGFI